MTQKSKRLYFIDPIKALYMMREFGVKFECKNSDEEMQEYDLSEDDRFYPFESASLPQPEMICDIIDKFDDFRKIYVCKESESIFEPREDDPMIHINKDSGNSCYTLQKRVVKGAIYFRSTNKIIMRNYKHFFSEEIENE